MSTDEKANEVSAEAADAQPVTPSSKTPGSDNDTENGAGIPIVLFFALGLIASLIVGWVIFPQVLYSQKRQPVDFNHALHEEEVDNSCESCHFFREDGTFSGVPKLAQCIECHEEVNGEDPEEEKFVNEIPFQFFVKAGGVESPATDDIQHVCGICFFPKDPAGCQIHPQDMSAKAVQHLSPPFCNPSVSESLANRHGIAQPFFLGAKPAACFFEFL